MTGNDVVDPLWGGHPFFTADGLDETLRTFLNRAGTAVDGVEVDAPTPSTFSLRAFRHPDLSQPPSGDGTFLLPDIRRRPAMAPLAELDPEGAVTEAVSRLLARVPARRTDYGWTDGPPHIELSRTGISCTVPFEHGRLALYAEGRVAEGAPWLPFWGMRTQVMFNLHDATASDLLAAGGRRRLHMALLKQSALGARLKPDVRPLPSRFPGSPDSALTDIIDFPLDAFNEDAGQ